MVLFSSDHSYGTHRLALRNSCGAFGYGFHVRAHAQAHDRHGGGVEADEHRAVDVVREHFQRAVDAVADVGDGVVEVGAPGETHDDGAGLLGADGGDLLDACDGADLAFDRARDELLDFLRGGVVVERGDGACREVDLREQVHGEVFQRDIDIIP